jgi:hypothetical protein
MKIGANTSQGALFRAWPDGLGSTNDFYIAIDVQKTEGASGEVGIAFRDSTPGFYLFSIEPRMKQYHLLRYYQEEWTSLVDWTLTSAILNNSTNHLGVLMIGSDITMYINNRQIAKASDKTLTSGTLDLTGGVFNKDETATYVFDNVEVYTP